MKYILAQNKLVEFSKLDPLINRKAGKGSKNKPNGCHCCLQDKVGIHFVPTLLPKYICPVKNASCAVFIWYKTVASSSNPCRINNGKCKRAESQECVHNCKA